VSRIYFTDRDLGKRFPSILVAGGLTVERHHDLFAPDAPDEEWLEYCGRGGRVAITHDQQIRHRSNERDAVMRHRVALLIVIGKLPYPELARHFVVSIPRIKSFLDKHTPPFIAKVYRPSPALIARNPQAPGDIVLWFPKPA